MEQCPDYTALMESIKQSAESSPLELGKIYYYLTEKCRGIERTIPEQQRLQAKKEVIAKLTLMTAPFDVWLELYDYRAYHAVDNLKGTVARNMVATATAFRHWDWMHKHCACFGVYAERIQQGMINSTSDLKLLCYTFSAATPGSEQQINAVDKIISLVTSFEAWFVALCYSPPESLLRERLIAHYQTLKVTFEQLWKAYRSSICKRKQLKTMVAGLFIDVDASFDQWCEVYVKVPAHCPLKAIARNKMKEKI